MKPGLLLWRKDGYAIVTKVAGEWVKQWLTGVTGATPSIPKFMLAAALATAKKTLEET
jgi:hypothetical protein